MANFITIVFELIGGLLKAIFEVIVLFFKLFYGLIIALRIPEALTFIFQQSYALVAVIA